MHVQFREVTFTTYVEKNRKKEEIFSKNLLTVKESASILIKLSLLAAAEL